jgi:hypothetical protein
MWSVVGWTLSGAASISCTAVFDGEILVGFVALLFRVFRVFRVFVFSWQDADMYDFLSHLPAGVRRRIGCAILVLVALPAAPALAQIKAVARPGATPPWTKGILPINPEN